MYYFTPATVAQANRQLTSLDAKVGGLFCILSCLNGDIEENVNYEINGTVLRRQLSTVFDKEPRDTFDNVKSSYVIFAKNWSNNFFNRYIKNKVDLIACAVFFLRRKGFESELTEDEIINIFISQFNLQQLKDQWFFKREAVVLEYNRFDVENNQTDFYSTMNYTNDFKSILFNGVIQKSAADIKAAGQIQTLYSGSGIQTCFLLSDEPLDQYYIMNNSVTAEVVADSIGSLSIAELGQRLKDMYSKADIRTTAVHMFGVKYAPIIIEKKYKLTDITRAAELGDTKYDVEIQKGINIYKSILDNQYGVRFYKKDDDSNFSSKQDSSQKVGENIIFYGVPGCGKSHKIKKEYCDDENFMERVVFHPDYTYSDFVGQILPENKDGHISYPFVPGPFTRILKKAHNDPDHNYYLIIEELNRGNAPAIFGEVFQLLDRVDGISEYGISNADIAAEVYGDPDEMVKIPSNLFILATMNTADQNVFTLDTAFKRRWRMRSVTSDISKCSFANDKICDSNVTWAVFLDSVNPLIIDYSERNLGSEDKRLGAYFVQHQELKNKEYFSEKVLMYLWNDAFKYEHEKIFDSKYKTLDELLTAFKSIGFKIFAPGVNFQSLIDTTSDVDLNADAESSSDEV